jgi:hypothetical protein
MNTSRLARDCHRCGAVVTEHRETVPYVGPGPHVVELYAVRVFRCTGCSNMTIQLPEPKALDTLIRCLGAELSSPLPQLAFEMSHWCILPRPRNAAKGLAIPM